jgi:uncharacterized protein (DUF305 family)
VAISLDDIHFLTMLIGHGEQTAALAREYLDTSSPAQRQARIADLANTLADTGQQQAEQARAWLNQAGITVPEDDEEPGDDGEPADDEGCDCG